MWESRAVSPWRAAAKITRALHHMCHIINGQFMYILKIIYLIYWYYYKILESIWEEHVPLMMP